MGASFSTLLYKILGTYKEIHVFMGGIDSAGKTTILYKIKLGEIVSTIPTIGYNVESFRYKNIFFTAWDCGGGDKIRPLFRHYYPNTQAIIYVIDSNDRARIQETCDELHKMLSDDELRGVPLLILANKQDIPTAMNVNEVRDKLDLKSIRHREWQIQGTCATSGDGLYEGLEWLSQRLNEAAVEE